MPDSWAEPARQWVLEMAPGVAMARGAQSWKEEKGSRTAPSGTRRLQAGLSSHQTASSVHLTVDEQQEKAPSPVLQIVQLTRTKALRWAWCWLFLSKNENKGRQKRLFGWITAARDTCVFAFPPYQFVVQTQATLQKWTSPLICFWETPVSRKQYEDNAAVHTQRSKISPLWNKTLESHLQWI